MNIPIETEFFFPLFTITFSLTHASEFMRLSSKLGRSAAKFRRCKFYSVNDTESLWCEGKQNIKRKKKQRSTATNIFRVLLCAFSIGPSPYFVELQRNHEVTFAGSTTFVCYSFLNRTNAHFPEGVWKLFLPLPLCEFCSLLFEATCQELLTEIDCVEK